MYLHSERKSVHIETESTIEGLQARTSASRQIRFQQSSQQPNVIGLEALVRACSPSVVLSVSMWCMYELFFVHTRPSLSPYPKNCLWE